MPANARNPSAEGDATAVFIRSEARRMIISHAIQLDELSRLILSLPPPYDYMPALKSLPTLKCFLARPARVVSSSTIFLNWSTRLVLPTRPWKEKRKVVKELAVSVPSGRYTCMSLRLITRFCPGCLREPAAIPAE